MSLSIINPFVFSTSGGGGETVYGVTSWSTPGSSVSLASGRYGWVFTVGASDLEVDRLRHFGANAAAAAVWRVIIHRNSDEAIMAQADVTKVEGAWAEELVTPVTLTAGATYTISARSISGSKYLYRNPTGITYASDITVDNSGVFRTTDDDNRPTSNSSNVYVPPADFGFTT